MAYNVEDKPLRGNRGAYYCVLFFSEMASRNHPRGNVILAQWRMQRRRCIATRVIFSRSMYVHSPFPSHPDASSVDRCRMEIGRETKNVILLFLLRRLNGTTRTPCEPYAEMIARLITRDGGMSEIFIFSQNGPRVFAVALGLTQSDWIKQVLG